MISIVALFGVLAALINVRAAPLPMPAAKQSDGLAARFYSNNYRYGQPVWTDGTPCLHSGRWGYLKNRHCSLIDLDAVLNLGIVKRDFYPKFAEGGPCWNEDRFGYFSNGECAIVDVDVDVAVKRSLVYEPYPYGQPVWLDGTPCWNQGRFGYLHDRTCSIVDLGLDIGLVRRQGDGAGVGIDADVGVGLDVAHAKKSWYPAPYYVDGTPCWNDDRFGYIKDALCIALDLDVLAKRGAHYPDGRPIVLDDSPCWNNGHFGYYKDSTCVVLDLTASVLKRGSYDPYGRPLFVDNSPCWENGRFGYFKDALCIVADLKLGLGAHRDWYKPVWNDGTPCWTSGRFGYLRDRTCALLEADVDVLVKKDVIPDLADGTPCWNEDKFGYIYNGICALVDVDVNIEKRLLEGVGILDGALGEPGYKFANSHPGNTPPPKGLGALGLKRNGLFHQAPGGSPVDSAVKSVNQLVGHTVEKKGLYRPGYLNDGDLVAELAAVVDVEGHRGYKNGGGRLVPGLGLKRSISGLDGVTGLVGGGNGKNKSKGKGTSGSGLPGLLG